MENRYPWIGWRLAALDAFLLGLSYIISYYMRYEIEFLRPVDEFNTAPFSPFIPYTLICIFLVVLSNQGASLYQDNRERTFIQEAFHITNAISNATIVVMALSFLLRPLFFSRLLIVQAGIIAILLLTLARIVLRLYRNSLHRQGIGVENVLVIGGGEVGRHVIKTIVARPNWGYNLVGFVDDNPEIGNKDIGRVPALGSTDHIESIVREQHVDLVIVTLPWTAQRKIFSLVEQYEDESVDIRIVPDFFQFNMSQLKIEMFGGLPLLGVRGGEHRFSRSDLLFKRVMDIVIAVIGLIVTAPIMAVTALAIFIEGRMWPNTRGDLLFAQTRVGFNGREFKMIKFRSMVPDAERQEATLFNLSPDDPEGKNEGGKRDDPRITRVGAFIRRMSIDELPQLWNVLRGDMSIVGPRPALPKEVAVYKAWHRQRLLAPPGITGLWQVSGRSDIPFEEKCLLDIHYIENWSLGLDMQIIIQTVPQVLFSKGAY